MLAHSVETMGFRVHRVFVSGPKKGSSEMVIDRLPGFPDGISRASDGNYWLCLVAPLSPLLPLLKLGAPVRYLLAHLLTSPLTQYLVKRWGMVVKISPSGEVLSSLMDRHGETVFTVSAVTEFGGKLWLGNLAGDFVSVVDLEKVSE